MRPSNRLNNELRTLKIICDYTKHAEGSVLVEVGNTKVICNTSYNSGIPQFLKNSGQGWLTAEYGMLPRSTNTRNKREAVTGKQTSRTIEIQRLIARSLRASIDLTLIGENTFIVDCDVIQADGGTRTAAITGGSVSLALAIKNLLAKGRISVNPFKSLVGAISVGLFEGVPVIDLDYAEDSNVDVDMNIVMLEPNTFIEIQGTAEKNSFSMEKLNTMLALAQDGIKHIFIEQRKVLENY